MGALRALALAFGTAVAWACGGLEHAGDVLALPSADPERVAEEVCAGAELVGARCRACRRQAAAPALVFCGVLCAQVARDPKRTAELLKTLCSRVLSSDELRSAVPFLVALLSRRNELFGLAGGGVLAPAQLAQLADMQWEAVLACTEDGSVPVAAAPGMALAVAATAAAAAADGSGGVVRPAAPTSGAVGASSATSTSAGAGTGTGSAPTAPCLLDTAAMFAVGGLARLLLPAEPPGRRGGAPVEIEAGDAAAGVMDAVQTGGGLWALVGTVTGASLLGGDQNEWPGANEEFTTAPSRGLVAKPSPVRVYNIVIWRPARL